MIQKRLKTLARAFAVTALAVASAQAVHAQSARGGTTAAMSAGVAAQIEQLQQNLDARSAAQQKLNSQLYFAAQYQRGLA